MGKKAKMNTYELNNIVNAMAYFYDVDNCMAVKQLELKLSFPKML
jgi:hypothetical protein